MIGLTQAFFSYAVAKLLDLDERFAVLGALIPGLSLFLIYAGPLQHEGILLSFTSALFFSLIVSVGFDGGCGKALFAGYSCSLLLEAFTFSYIPVFYPFHGFQGLGLFSGFDPVWNLGVVSVSLLVLAFLELKK